jgi:hypothetical protein
LFHLFVSFKKCLYFPNCCVSNIDQDTNNDTDDGDNTNDEQLLDISSTIPKGAVALLASLDAMQNNSLETTREKQVTTLIAPAPTSPSIPDLGIAATNNKIHCIVIENACIGDEDIKCTNLVIGNLTKSI